MEPESDEITINGKSYHKDKILKFDIQKMKEKNIYDDMRNANFNQMYFDFEEEIGKKVILFQDLKMKKGGVIWDSSYLLIKYLLQELETSWKREDIKPSSIKILELGSGTGLPSIVAGHLGYNVVATDLPSLIPFIEKNVFENIPKDKNVQVKALEWGKKEDFSTIEGPFNYILGAEVAYADEYFDVLIETLKYYSDENTRVILAFKIRLPERTELFMSKMREVFEAEYVDQSYIKKILPNPNMYIVVAKKKA